MMKRFLSIFTESEQSFEGQEASEKVILIIRRHYFTVMFPLGFLFLLALVPPLAWQAFGTQIADAGLEALFTFFSALWYLFLWLVVFYLLTFYTLNTFIITNKRIIENEQHDFFNRKVSELHIYRVQDVSVHTHGVIETFLKFGELAVQTAGAEREFTFSKIPHPERVKDAIMKTVSAHRSSLRLD